MATTCNCTSKKAVGKPVNPKVFLTSALGCFFSTSSDYSIMTHSG